MNLHIDWRKKWPNLLFITLFIIWISSLFIAPALLSPNTIQGLDGHSTFIDYANTWNNLSAYPHAVYLLGDVLCHQKDGRCFEINENQMPVCSRCLSVYVGFLFALIFTLFIPNTLSKNEYFLRTLPKNLREKAKRKIGLEFLPLILIGLFLLPLAIDGGMQLFTSYESNHMLRILTGLPAGWMAGVLLGAIVNT